ncbi:MAG TPA: hypothetical protein HA360_06120 [Nanoarchaeota archaeon]|nr:hypothetical protein [Candidatus Woesearchaeota archaeon]HIH15577.1 hypothetical protein [Nanoarchaeota archaeon]HIH59092.1 hypothetical protein [Nanoarchaeota archaeon]HII14620.1 hypothetical protein [Nanoarchaeota archaeon]HIJ05437.1 hypothetical protein [Nanoarchaeota archaeon]
MPKDPIQELKEDLQKIMPLFDQLRIEINASKQTAASDRVKDIQAQLDDLKKKIHNNFHWLAPAEPVTQKKSSFFSLKR